jgi:hypothetical protein
MRSSADTTGMESALVEVDLAQIHATMGEEFRGLRKLLRKQRQMLEELHERQWHHPLPEQMRTESGLIDLASAFFHLHQSLRERVADSPPHREALALFWLQLDSSLRQVDVHMIREEGAPFDARLHRAVLSRDAGSGNWVVAEVLEPGFIRGDVVATPAKVILAHTITDQDDKEENP